MKKFWNFIRNDAGERVLRLEGPIDEESFWGDEVTPSAFRDELEAEEGDVTVWINSPGGNVFAASEIYTMLCDHKGKVTVKIDAIAASAASVIAMAGDTVLMSPVAMLMVHDPMTIAMGNTRDMEKTISTLNEVKESIINAYVRKTGMSRNRVSKLMENETWMNAKKAVEMGFADAVLFTEDEEKEGGADNVWQPYSTRAMGRAILNRLAPVVSDQAPPTEGNTAEKPPSEEPQIEKDTAEEPPMEGPVEEPLSDVAEASPPVIGLDGRTPDGAMPYEILKDKLAWLR